MYALDIHTRTFVQALQGCVPRFCLQVYAHLGVEIVRHSGWPVLEQCLYELRWVDCVSGVRLSYKFVKVSSGIRAANGVRMCLDVFAFTHVSNDIV